jgi:hypothetical protein
MERIMTTQVGDFVENRPQQFLLCNFTKMRKINSKIEYFLTILLFLKKKSSNFGKHLITFGLRF